MKPCHLDGTLCLAERTENTMYSRSYAEAYGIDFLELEIITKIIRG